MTLDDNESDETGTGDKAEGTSGDVDAGHIGRDTCLRTTFGTLEVASGQTKSIDASGPWYDVEEGCYIDEPTSRLGSREQQGNPPPFTQEQPQIFPQSPQPLQDQINQKGIDDITQQKNSCQNGRAGKCHSSRDLRRGDKEDSAMQQAAERGGKGGQDEEEDEGLDESALEEYSHNGEEEDGPVDSKDEDCDWDSIDEEYEGIRSAKRRRLPSPLSDEGLEGRGQHSSRPDIKQRRCSPPTATERGHVRSKTMRSRAQSSAADEQLHTLHPFRSPSGTKESEAWQISFDHVKEQSKLAAKLLCLWAYFDSQDLWLELLQ